MLKDNQFPNLSVVVLIPCHNEATTIRKTVENFHSVLPNAKIYVYDNLSTDRTIEEALAGGAIVRNERWLGKGNVVRRMFADIDADVYLMADGDGTYDYSISPLLIKELIDSQLDMVVGIRSNVFQTAHRPLHGFGNMIFNRLYHLLFDYSFSDIFSGYRAFTRRFVKSFPAISNGFEIEAEMSVHASQLRIPTAEIPTKYGARIEGSTSKLRTLRDGFRIFCLLVILFKEIRPIYFFGLFSAFLFSISIVFFVPIVVTYLETGLVPRFPTLILLMGLFIAGVVFLQSGIILDSVARGRLEAKRMLYLIQPSLNNLFNHLK
jgi:glycosyltransferase involved in cell wall biosynthesis